MAAAAALNVVKQIEALADSPDSPNMNECLGQLVTSLQFFLDHPDSRVRLGAARTLMKLARGYPASFSKCDLSKAKNALARCRATISENDGEPDKETLELLGFLEDFLEEGKSRTEERSTAKGSTSTVSDTPATSSKDGRGEVVLKVRDDGDMKAKTAILQKVVTVVGVVSVAFEGDLVIVNTRTPEIANDPAFTKELLAAISAEGLEGVTAVKRPTDSVDTEEPEPVVLDDDDDCEEPAYLDDDEDDEPPAPLPNNAGQTGGQPGANPAGGNWSFFAQTNWMTGRRVTEYDEDPTIAARLARAKQRQEEKKKEEESRIGFLSRWMGRRS